MGIAYLGKPKQPYEELYRYVDFADRIASGDAINACTITAMDQDGTDTTGSMITDPSTYSAGKVYYTLKGGTDGNTYTIRFRATSVDTKKVEEDLVVVVKEY